jgi:hypothetical protein
MSDRLVAEFRGTARVKSADGVFVVSEPRGYYMAVYQHQIPAGPGQTIPGMFNVRGQLELEGFEGMHLMTRNRGGLVMVISDSDAEVSILLESSNGRFTATSDLPELLRRQYQ